MTELDGNVDVNVNVFIVNVDYCIIIIIIENTSVWDRLDKGEEKIFYFFYLFFCYLSLTRAC